MSKEVDRGVVDKIKDWKRKLADDRNSNPLLNLSKSRKAKVDVFTPSSILFKNLAEGNSGGIAIEELRTQPVDNELIKKHQRTSYKSSRNCY